MRRFAALPLLGLALLAGGCGTGGLAEAEQADTGRGKLIFTEKCGQCHVMADAGTQGRIGPHLDEAFAPVRSQGYEESSIFELVHKQVKYAQPPMPNGEALFPDEETRDEDILNVSAYVARNAGLPPEESVPVASDEGASGDGGSGADEGETEDTVGPTQEGEGTQTETGTGTSSSGAGASGQSGAGASGQSGAAGGDAAGRRIFTSNGCDGCHVLADAGANGMIGPNLDEAEPSVALAVTRVTNGKGAMPPYRGQLSAAQIRTVAEYVAAASRK